MTTMLFTAPPYPFPATRKCALWPLVPLINRQEDDAGTGDLRKFILCLEEICHGLLYDSDRWTDILDADLAPEPFLDAMLYDLGNPFDFDLTETDKRRLIHVLLDVYRQKGTAVGIINVIRFFLGLTVTILCYLDVETWVLGENALGDDLLDPTTPPTAIILGPGTSWGRFAFEIESPVALTDEQRKRITDLANFMKPAHTHLNRIVEPAVPPVYDHLELGISLLDGVEWDLHG